MADAGQVTADKSKVGGLSPGYGVGFGNQASYVVSGIPFITGSTFAKGTGVTTAGPADGPAHHIVFPLVTRSIHLKTMGCGEIRIAMVNTGSVSDSTATPAAAGNSPVNTGKHYWTLSGSTAVIGDTKDEIKLDIRVREIYVYTNAQGNGEAVDFTCLAELTRIGANQCPHLTGSGLTTGDGT